MHELHLPGYAFKVRSASRGEQIFDPVRKMYVALTPEEWVRQHFLNFLVEHRGCPMSLLKVERGMKMNGLAMRTDIVVHSSQGRPIAIVECKAPEVNIDQSTLDQTFRYDRVLKVDYILLTNGMDHYCYRIENDALVAMNKIPRYEEMVANTQQVNG